MTPNHLDALRIQLRAAGVDGFIVPRADEHLGEYVPPGAERLAWLTGFTGSAGLAAVLQEKAAVFTDGRYTLQLEAQTDPALFERRHILEHPPQTWLAEHAPKPARIGYDPRLIAAETLERYVAAGLDMVPLPANPLDAAWQGRPPPPAAPAIPHPLAHAGQPAGEKIAAVAADLAKARDDAAILTDPASIAWLLNIRGDDIPFTPFALGFALVHADSRVALFMDPAKIPPETRAWLPNQIALAPPSDLQPALQSLRGARVRTDRALTPIWFAQTLQAAGATVTEGPDPCTLPKSCKNPIEQQGARDAHLRDAAALCRFLHWLDTARTPATTEMDAAARLLSFRAELPGFKGESFPAISGSGPNGAIIHYRVTPETDRPLGENEAYLIDSGAQFIDGTTDVTRTVWTGPGTPPPDLVARVTRVMQGHIAIATAIFPQGVAGPHIDAFARRALWSQGLDYDHGTGHGVGSYLSVHEGPASISRAARPIPLAPGMILSDEPGFYEPGHYGIRLENLLVVQPAPFPHARKPFLHFETLTLAPFDRRLLDPSLLTPQERAWLDAYHARVLDSVSPALAPPERAWLEHACAPLP